MSQNRIREWYDHWNGDVYISFSGGKDSTVLAHLVHDLYPDVPMVFSNTGLEYPEIQAFARKMGAEFVRPKMMFSEVISTYEYPIISKNVAEAISYSRMIVKERKTQHSRIDDRRDTLRGQYGEKKENGERTDSMFNKTKWKPLCDDTQFLISDKCCQVMKKSPLKMYQRKTKRKPYLGVMAEESLQRTANWIMNGCNAFEGRDPKSLPLSVWTEQDVLKYIKENQIEICSVYGDIVAEDSYGFQYDPLPGIDCKLKCSKCTRTGCIFCAFGAQFDKEPRFKRLARTHPKQYEYCMGGGQWVDNPFHDPAAPKMDGDWKNWNPKKIWVPSKKGLGMKKVFDDCNQIYGKDFIRYE